MIAGEVLLLARCLFDSDLTLSAWNWN